MPMKNGQKMDDRMLESGAKKNQNMLIINPVVNIYINLCIN